MPLISYRNYLLGVLLSILACNYQERAVLALALQNIKAELHLSDTQLGFLSGIAFAVFYSVMGIPIARWADRANRVKITAMTTALWGVMVAMCGIAGNYLQLLLIRIGVAIGEAGCIPTAHSLIPDYFARGERARAASIYMLAGWLSIAVGYPVAGWLIQAYGWRSTFVVLGLPGLPLAAMAWLTLKEPRLGKPKLRAPSPSARETWTALRTNRTFTHLLIGFAVLFFFVQGVWQWLPAYFVRRFGVETGELGAWFALTAGLPGLIGTLFGGELASRWATHNEPLQLKGIAGALVGFGVLSACVYLSPNQYVAFGFLALANLGGAAANGPLFAIVQSVVPERVRATSIAIIYLVANLVGMGLGPLVTGAMSDALTRWGGQDSLRYALLALCPGYGWAAWHLWHARTTVSEDLVTVSDFRVSPEQTIPAELRA